MFKISYQGGGPLGQLPPGAGGVPWRFGAEKERKILWGLTSINLGESKGKEGKKGLRVEKVDAKTEPWG